MKIAAESEDARRAHSVFSAIQAAVLVWYAVLGSIGAWAVHLVLFVAYVRFTCNRPGTLWVMHVATAVTLALTALALALCGRMLRGSQGDESSDGDGGRAQFLARLGLLIGVVNFALITLEEVYLLVLGAKRCG